MSGALLAALAMAAWQVLEARRLSEAQAQPFVVVDFDAREHLVTLPPGKEMRTLLDSFPQREQTGGFPDAYTVTARCSDRKGKPMPNAAFHLDIGLYRDVLSVSRDDVHDLNNTLDKVLKEMKRWSGGSGRRGLLTMSPDQKRAEGKRQMRELRERPQILGGQGKPGWRTRVANLLPFRRSEG